MKYIEKQGEPQAFTGWKALENDDWQPTYDNLSSDVKQSIKTSLIIEQGYICCYCERRLTVNDSHIEHVRPQESFPELALEYSNMLCSCQNQLQIGVPRHCGHLKGNWYNDNFLSPLDPVCERKFIFYYDGRIKPANVNDLAATETINRLGLDIPKLKALRKGAIDAVIEIPLTEDEMNQFVSDYLQKDSSGMFSEFYTTIRYLFGGNAII